MRPTDPPVPLPPSPEEGAFRALLERARIGDRAAEDELSRVVRDAVRAAVRRRLGAAVRALRPDFDEQDIEQEAAAQVFVSLAEYEHRDRASFFAWVHRLTENKARDLRQRAMAQKRSRSKTVSIESSAAEPVSDSPPLSVGQALERGERIERVSRALAALSEADRELLRLVYFQQQSVRGAARRLGLSEPTARRRAGRAKARVAFLMVRHDREQRDGRVAPE